MSTVNPLHQFEVTTLHPFTLAGHNIAFTNQTLWMWVAVAAILLFLVGGTAKIAMVPGRWQAMVEIVYEFAYKLVSDMGGEKALKFFPLLFSLFLFIASMNLVGLIPSSYTVTSQFITTQYMALVTFVLVMGVALYSQGLHFFAHFLPPGTPIVMAPLIVLLEVISFFVRPLTLAVRLAVNMVAGHILLKLFASFVIMMMMGLGWFAFTAIAPLGVLVFILALELLVAVLQAYIFTVLTCIYLSEALAEPHHEGHA